MAILVGAALAEHEKYDSLFRQGARIDDVFLVLSGLVRLYRVSKDEREADVGVFAKGELFGEDTMFLGHRATANAEVAENSVIARVDSRRLRQLAASGPDVAQAFIEHLCHRGKMKEGLLAQDRLLTAPAGRELSSQPLPERLDEFFLPAAIPKKRSRFCPAQGVSARRTSPVDVPRRSRKGRIHLPAA